ncbi:MAG TPA: TonB family protein [Candidatus Gastranaerophilaceae bacterium]|nr:TonB family protein [Candidatus Gastranaerophilaceae bacterium]HPT41943.1 TonB family protein [Candidatus Gastranaerophilaceae bacterium]
MAILGNINSLIDDDDIKEKESYTIPSVLKHSQEGISFKKSLVLSTVLHPAVVGLVWLIILILTLMGITLSIFEKPKPKMNDIEFVLVDKEQMPLNKKTPYRADRNSRTGGKRDPKKKVSMPSPSPTKKAVQQQSRSSQSAKKPSVKKPQAQKVPQKKNVFEQLTQKQPQARPQPPSARPSIKPPSVPRPSVKPNPEFAVPIPKASSSSTGKTYSTGPIGGSGSAKTGSSGSGRSYAPVPSLSPSGGSGSSAGSSGSKMSKGSSGYGNYGNPGGGGGAPGIDAIREPDFGPYMRELQRRIKMNWDPPKGNESKRVILLFKIARDGRLLSIKVFKSSGVPSADKAALSAVELTAPFKPLPPDYKGSSIDIQFTFDYNVFGATNY